MKIKPKDPKFIYYEYFQEGGVKREQIQFIFQGLFYSNSFSIVKFTTGSMIEEYHQFHKTERLEEERCIMKEGRFYINRYFIYDPELDLQENIYGLLHSTLEEISHEELIKKIRMPPPPNEDK